MFIDSFASIWFFDTACFCHFFHWFSMVCRIKMNYVDFIVYSGIQLVFCYHPCAWICPIIFVTDLLTLLLNKNRRYTCICHLFIAYAGSFPIRPADLVMRTQFTMDGLNASRWLCAWSSVFFCRRYGRKSRRRQNTSDLTSHIGIGCLESDLNRIDYRQHLPECRYERLLHIHLWALYLVIIEAFDES